MWRLLLRKENSTVAILSTSKVRNSISMIVQLNLAAAGFGNCDSSLDGFESRFESIFSKKKKKMEQFLLAILPSQLLIKNNFAFPLKLCQ